MAQNQFINVTVDPSASKKVDNADHRHTVTPAGSSSGDATFSYDNTKITSVSLAKSVFAQMLANIAGQLPK